MNNNIRNIYIIILGYYMRWIKLHP